MSRYPSTTSTNDLDKEPNQQTNSSQPASNQGEARTKESRCLPSHGKTSHHPPAGSTSTAWVEKVARKQEFELLVNPSDLLAPPCFSFCIPTSRDPPPSHPPAHCPHPHVAACRKHGTRFPNFCLRRPAPDGGSCGFACVERARLASRSSSVT